MSGRKKLYRPTRQELADLRLQGVEVTPLSVSQFSAAYILNVHFKAGEWVKAADWGNEECSRCGSVVTCVISGRSLYARVLSFLQVDDDDCPGYASVEWFSEPSYIFDDAIPLGVRVKLDGNNIDSEVGSIIRITQIDPCPVMVEKDGDSYYMMRDIGYDTRS